MKSLHFKSNSNLDKLDKFSKLWPLILVEYFGKNGYKQARNKPKLFGYKVWCQNYLIAFDPYQGNEMMESKFGKCAFTVLHLLN